MKRFFLYWIPSALITALVVLFVVTDPRVLEMSANAGSATAARWLGEHYNQYEKQERYDPEKALLWFERAAELGSVDALYEIGDLHFRASIEGHTYKTAYDYYRKAAEVATSARCINWRSCSKSALVLTRILLLRNAGSRE